MARILLAGNSPDIARIASQFRDWGMVVREQTDGPVTASDTHSSQTDVVVMMCSPETGSTPCPLPSAFADGCAPILLVGGQPEDCHCRGHCWRWTTEDQAYGAPMLESLESCLGRAEWPQAPQKGEQYLLDYVQFLNHEMRSPLAALQNALQILALDSSPDGDPRQRFLQIALRNAQRLSTTMDWNEEILAVRERAAAPQWQWQDAATVCRRFSKLSDPMPIDLCIAPEIEQTRIFTDASLLEALLRQILRAVECHYPGSSLRLALAESTEYDAAGAAGAEMQASLSLIFSRCPTEAADPNAGPVARTGLVSPRAKDEDELNRLLTCTICPEAVQSLGARIEPSPAHGDGTLLKLILPLIPSGAGSSRPDRDHARNIA